MRIDHELDKVFRVTITEKEALQICDMKEVDFNRSKQIIQDIGHDLLFYMIQCCEQPYACQPSITVEL